MNVSNSFDLLTKNVRIRLKSGVLDRPAENELTGWLFTIDPITHTHVIVKFTDDLSPDQVTIVLKDQIETVESVPCDLDKSKIDLIHRQLDGLFEPHDSPTIKKTLNRAEIMEKRDILIAWLQKNRLQVKLDNQDDGENVVINILDSVYIHPPYEARNCVSTNEIILDRVRNLIINQSRDS